MTYYLLGNLESRHILPDNNLWWERAKINVRWSCSSFGQRDYNNTMSAYVIWGSRSAWGRRNSIRANTELLIYSVSKWEIRLMFQVKFMCKPYPTVVWWWRSHTQEFPHPRCWRPSVWSHSESWGLRDGEGQWKSVLVRRDERDKLMQPSIHSKTLEALSS